MKHYDLTFSRGPRVQLGVRDLEGGRVEVRSWNGVTIWEPGEFAYDPVQDELHLPLAPAQQLIRQPYRH